MQSIQYTIRGVPREVDLVLKKRAKLMGKSFNQTAVEALLVQTIGSINKHQVSAFDKLFGANTLDKDFDEAISDLSKIDENEWV